MIPALRLVSNTGSGHSGTENGLAPKANNGAERKPTLLVVEDEILIRLAAADYLRERGYRVIEASNASEAVSVFAAGQPIELVFSDIDMPRRMNGDALAQWIRQHFPDVKVLLCAIDGGKGIAKSTNAQVLKKPYSYDLLLAQINALLKA